MAISTDFDYAVLLSLERAELGGRTRENYLGSKELIIQYKLQTSGAKEDAVEWLEANRLTVTNPKISNKTFEGTWNCVTISYNEQRHVIQQTFKIDSQVGNLGDVDDESDHTLQTSELAQISDGEEIYKSYYWRVVDPEAIELPDTAISGEIWTKSSVDNGDGTYDVTVSKQVAQNLTADSYVQASSYTEDISVSTNNSELDWVSNGGTIADATVGEIKKIENIPLENGKYRTTVTTRTAVAQSHSFVYPNDYSADGGLMYIGVNRTSAQLAADIAAANPSPWSYVLSVSVRINDYGLYDYTISGRV